MTNDDFVFMVFIYGRTTATVSNALMPSSVALSSSKHLVWFVMWDSVTPASAPCSFIITYFSIYVKPLISDACRISLEGGLGRSESVFEIVFLPAMGLGIFDGYQLNLCLNGEEELTWIPSSLFCIKIFIFETKKILVENCDACCHRHTSITVLLMLQAKFLVWARCV
jgi:hypothetical protein